MVNVFFCNTHKTLTMYKKISLIALLAVSFSCKKNENNISPELKENETFNQKTSISYNEDAIIQLKNQLSQETNDRYKSLLQERISYLSSLDDSLKALSLPPTFSQINSNKKIASSTYLTPEEKKELEEYYKEIYGASASDFFSSPQGGGSSGHVSVSGLPNISVSVSFNILDNILGLWSVNGKCSVMKNDQIVTIINDNIPVGSYAEIDGINNISSSITGITSLFGQEVSWNHISGSSEVHGRYANVSVDGTFSTSNPLFGSSTNYYSGVSLYVDYIKEIEMQ